MNSLELMESRLSSFSKTDRQIYEMIKKFPSDFAYNSITAVSCNTGMTKPALTRFAKKLGFGGFAEFQYQLGQDLKELKENKSELTRAEMFARLLKQTEDTVDREELKELIRKMKKSRRVILMGSNLSRIPAEVMLINLSFDTDIVSSLAETDFIPYYFSKDDMVIIYSAISGGTFQNFMKSLRRDGVQKPYMVLITVNSKHPLRHNFDQTIVLPTMPLGNSSDVVLSDTFSFLMFNDIFSQVLKETEKR